MFEVGDLAHALDDVPERLAWLSSASATRASNDRPTAAKSVRRLSPADQLLPTVKKFW